VRELVVSLPAEVNEHGDQMLWYGSWLVSDDGTEGEGFYSGRGGLAGRFPVPPAAVGVRVRRWPNEGLEPEYADLIGLASSRKVGAGDLDFDITQPFSRLHLPDSSRDETWEKGSAR